MPLSIGVFPRSVACSTPIRSAPPCCRGRSREAPLRLSGYEMQKSLAGQADHQDEVAIAFLDNAQDIPALVQRIAQRDEITPLRYGYLTRGHGLTCWGRDVREARRHLEGLEFLFECEWRRRLLEAR